MESTSFPRAARLTETDEFSSVFALRPHKRSRHFVLYIKANGATHARLGLVIGKKFAPRAVERNLIKRVARELFRHRQHRLGGQDVLLRLQARFPRVETPTRSALLATCRAELSMLLDAAMRPSRRAGVELAVPAPSAITSQHAEPRA